MLVGRVRRVFTRFKLKHAADYSLADLRHFITISLVEPYLKQLRKAYSAHRATAPYLATLLRLRGYAVYDGDLESTLAWLESARTPETLPPPSETLRRYLSRAHGVTDASDQIAPLAPFDDDDDLNSESSDELDASTTSNARRGHGLTRGVRRGRGHGRGRGRGRGRSHGHGRGRARSRSREKGDQ